MIRTVIYARYSSTAQREESIEGQLRECRDYASKHDLVIIGEYIDRAISGKTDNRSEFQRMIRDAEKGHFQAVLVYAIDRFARNRYDSAIYKAKLKKNGVKVHYAKQYIPDTPEGIILESVMEGYAEYYSENLSIHIKRGLHENALQCKVNGGQVPLGYRISPNRTYEIDPVGSKVVQEIFHLYADGYSTTEICRFCNERGYRSSTGATFNKNSLRVLLKNDKYIGVYRFGGVVIEDGIPAIITKELFDRVQSKLKQNYAARARKKAVADYLLSGKLFCGHCGSPMIGESGTSRHGSLYHYYKCNTRKHKKGSCDKQTEKKDDIEQFVVQVTLAQLTDARIEAIATTASELLRKEAENDSLLPTLKSMQHDIHKRIKNIMDAMEMGIVTDSTKERLLELEARKADLEAQIESQQMKKPLLTKEQIIFWLESIRSGDISNPEYQRKIIDTFVNSIFIYDSGGKKGRKIVITWNLSGANTETLIVSDIACFGVPNYARSNTYFVTKHVFGCVIEIEDMG